MPPKILIDDDDEIARQVSAALLAECGAAKEAEPCDRRS